MGRILIAGGMGFLGSNLARALALQGEHPRVIDNLDPRGGANPYNLWEIDGLTLWEADVLSVPCESDIWADVDVAFLLAGRTGHSDSQVWPVEDLRANVAAPLHAMKCLCRQSPKARVITVSSRQVYMPSDGPVSETDPVRPPDMNAVNKLALEASVDLYRSTMGLDAVCLRLTSCFGPRMAIRQANQNYLGQWLHSAIDRSEVVVYESAGTSALRDYLYVDDAIDALIRIAFAPRVSHVLYNLGGSHVESVESMAILFTDVFPGLRILRSSQPPELSAISVTSIVLDSSLFAHEFDWRPQVPILEGLRRSRSYFEREWLHYR